MKQISEEQIKQILDALMEVNVPVKVYAGVQTLFTNLPLVKEEK